jgi:TPR repeat protein
MATKGATRGGTRPEGGRGSVRDRDRRSGEIDFSEVAPLRGEKSGYRKAIDLAKREGYSERVAGLLWSEHRRGDARATFALSTWYHFGCLYKVDAKRAFTLARQAHRKGIRLATFNLAVSYERGWGVQKSAAKAFDLYVQAARKGERDAIDEVLRCVFWGIGTARNRQLAFLIEDLAKRSGTWKTEQKR